MNKFFKEYFHDAKHDKIKENVFVFRMCFSVGIIFVCMFAMAFAAYGFFSSDIYTQPSAISSARYSLSVKGMEGMVLPVWEASDTEQTDSVQIMSPNAPAEVSINVPGSVAQYSLAPGNYTFVLEKEVGPDFASTGYCKIVFNGKYQAENSDAYYTKHVFVGVASLWSGWPRHGTPPSAAGYFTGHRGAVCGVYLYGAPSAPVPRPADRSVWAAILNNS